MAKKISVGDFAARVASMGEEFEEAAIAGLQSAAFRLEGLVVEKIGDTKPFPPENTGEMVRSTHTTRTRKGATVSVDAPHAPFMEYGTRPHFPPLEPLAEWAYQKGLADSEEEAQAVALGVARKIAAKGLEPRHFMARAIKELKRRRWISREIKHELKRRGLKGPAPKRRAKKFTSPRSGGSIIE